MVLLFLFLAALVVGSRVCYGIRCVVRWVVLWGDGAVLWRVVKNTKIEMNGVL